MYKNKAVNVITIIFAVFLSIDLCVLCAVIPVYMSAATIYKPRQIKALIKNIDYVELFEKSDSANNMADEMGLSSEALDRLMKSEVTDDLVDLYAKDIDNFIKDKDEPSAVTADAIKQIARDNIDEIVDISFENGMDNKSKAELKSKILEAVDNNAQEISEMFPDVNDLGVKNTPEIKLLRNLFKPAVWITMIVVAVILAALIYVCRMKCFKALLWLGVDFGVAALPLMGIATVLGSGILNSILPSNAVINSMIKVYNNGIITGLIIMLVLNIVCIVGYILLNRFVKKPCPETEPQLIQTVE